MIKHTRKEQQSINKEIESQLVIKALRVNTLSKLTYDDTHLFHGIVRDVFPGIEAPDISYDELEQAIRAEFRDRGLMLIESQIRKILQFYEATKQRTGVVIVGPSGSGKSIVWTVLRDALRRMDQNLTVYIINPKSIPRQQLLGYMNMDTREWHDGILTASARKVVKDPVNREGMKHHHFLVFDGDIDPEWVESLNSVLDDNKLLTLPSGERIQFGSCVNFIFETHSLAHASPATVSRMGMIFLSDEDVKAQSLISTWIKQIPEDMQPTISTFIDSYFFNALDKVNQYASDFVVETSIVGLIRSGLSHLGEVETKGEFAVGLIRGFGGYLRTEDRMSFARDIYAMCGEYPSEYQKRPLDYYFHREGNRFEPYVYDPSSEQLDFGNFIHGNLMIHTVEIQRTLDVLDVWLRKGHSFIIVGPEGSGKNMILQNLFADLTTSTHVATIHCNVRTRTTHIIQKLDEVCNVFQTNQGKVLRPKEGERLILYFKDLNLPKPDNYGTTQLISFLHQVLTYQGYYDENLEWIGIEKVQVVASMNPSTTIGRYPLCSRLNSIMHICSIDYPSKQQLETIYTHFLKTMFYNDEKFSMHPVWRQPNNISLLAEGMVELYTEIKDKFRVDEYAHYLFTPRDLTNMVLGLLRYEYTYSDKADEVIDFWINEARRTFCDRIVRNHSLYASIESAVLRKFDVFDFQSKLDQGIVFTTFTSQSNSESADIVQQNTISTHSNLRTTFKTLKPLGSKPLATIVTDIIRDYSREYRRLRFFITADTMHFVSRVDRVLSQPSGSMLLVGRPGIGRKNTVLLVAHKLGLDLVSPNITLEYGIKAFENEIKQLMLKAGVENESVCLLLEDHQIVSPSFLEIVNSLLSAGEVPGLFTREEQEQLLAPLREQQSQEGSFGSLYSFFVSRVYKNLRIVLIMDPTNPSFALNCQSNPAIFTKCYIAWMENWSKSQFLRIPKAIIGSRELENMGDENKQRMLLKLMNAVHESISSYGATPLQYMQFIDTFRHIFIKERKTKEEQIRHLSQGLQNLQDAANDVDRLSQEAHKQKNLLAQKQQQQSKALEQIRESMQLSVNETNEIERIKTKIGVEEEKVNERKAAVDDKLSQVQPVLEAALRAVQSVSKRDLDEIRSLIMPPEGVRDVLEGVVKLLGIPDTSWKGIKSTMSRLKDEILNFNARNITPAIERSVQELLSVKGSSFEEANAARVSKACAPLAKWVKANIQYSQVLKTVAPLEEQMYELTASQNEMKDRLQQCEKRLTELGERVTDMQREFEIKTREAETLKLAVQRTETILSKSQNLIEKLSDERDRWIQQVRQESKILEALPMYVLLAAAFIVYLPGTAEIERQTMLKRWKSLVKSQVDDFDIKTFMSTENVMLQHKAAGLPGDDLSMENAIAILEMIQYPLIIDPAQQAIQWLKNHLVQQQQQQQQQDVMTTGSSNVEITSLHDPSFVNTLELSIRFGKTLVIQEVDRIEPMLFPLLRREFILQGTRKSIYVGDKLLDYNDDFRLYLTTRNPNICLTPDAASLITQVYLFLLYRFIFVLVPY